MDECVYPIQIEKVGEYLVVLDIGNNSQRLSVYTLSGKLIQRFGNLGHAENEIGNIGHFFKLNEHQISVHKPNGILIYDLDSLEEAGLKYKFMPIKINSVGIQDVYPDSSGVLCFLNSHEERFSFTDKDGTTFNYNIYPKGFVDNTNDLRAVFNYAPIFGVDMKNKRFCFGTYIGGLLETFQITSNGIESCGENELFKSKYKELENGAVSWSEESLMGFQAISVGEDYIYTLLNGAKGECLMRGELSGNTDKITVFNWTATKNSEIQVGHYMLSMCVSEKEKKAYAICFENGNGFYLICITW